MRGKGGMIFLVVCVLFVKGGGVVSSPFPPESP